MKSAKSTQYNYFALNPKKNASSQTNNVSTFTLFTEYETVQRLNEAVELSRQMNAKLTSKVTRECQTECTWNSQLKNLGANFVEEFKMLVSTFTTLVWAEKLSSSKECFIEVLRKNAFEPEFGCEPSKLILTPLGYLEYHVLFRGCIRNICVLSDKGLSHDLVSEFLSDFGAKDYVLCGDCPVWFKKPSNASGPLQNVCTACKTLARYLKVCLKRREESIKSPCRKRKMDPSSTFPEKFLSPYSSNKKKRHQLFRLQNLKTKNSKLMAKLEALKVNLKPKQHDEMKHITTVINNNFTKEIDEALSGNKTNLSTKDNRKRLREIWNQDCATYLRNEKEQFKADQDKNAPGHKGNRWSIITYRIALSVACRSKAAYEALKGFKILNLPSWRSVQRKTSKNLDEPGINMEYLKEQKITYDNFAKEQVSLGLQKPQCDGLLIFDEVRVAAKVVWNSKNHKFIGLAMPKEDYAYLDDLYQEISDDKNIAKAKYMLQFLWRDVTANYDIVGPFFSTTSTADTHFTFNCLFEVIQSFQYCGFNIAAIVCDGASANLSLVKLTAGLEGQFNCVNKDDMDDIDISFSPCFPNPYRLDRHIHWIICPSHELKSLINSLYSSDPERAKRFCNDGVNFGWLQIKQLKERDDELRSQNIPRLVPKLVQSYVDRDAWTKLNVQPAKILQQNDVLSALYEYANPKVTRPPVDQKEVMATFNYLKACNSLFENGTLSWTKIESPNCEVMANIKNGLDYFTKWLKDLIAEDPEFKPWDVKQKKFISWQTWALLRVMVFGLQGLVKEFFDNYPQDYYLCPVRINGSAVETLFSQFKHSAGGKLSSVNYNTCRKALLTKIDVKGHHSGKGYRDVPLYVREAFEEKFKPNKTI